MVTYIQSFTTISRPFPIRPHQIKTFPGKQNYLRCFCDWICKLLANIVAFRISILACKITCIVLIIGHRVQVFSCQSPWTTCPFTFPPIRGLHLASAIFTRFHKLKALYDHACYCTVQLKACGQPVPHFIEGDLCCATWKFFMYHPKYKITGLEHEIH